MKTIYAEELGSPVATQGRYHVFAERDLFRIYIVSEEWDFNDKGEIFTTGRIEATPAGYITNLENLQIGIDAIEEEMRSLSV